MLIFLLRKARQRHAPQRSQYLQSRQLTHETWRNLHADSTIFSSTLAAGRCASTAFRFWTTTTRAAACRRDKIGMVGGDKLVKSSGAYTWTWRKFALRRNAVHLMQRNRLPKIERKAHTVVRSLSVITRTCGRRRLGNKVADARLSPHPRKRGHDRAESFAREPL